MPKKKRPSLIDQVEKLSARQGVTGITAWQRKLANSDPELLAEVEDLIDRFHRGLLDHKFASACSLARFLIQHVPIAESTMARYINNRSPKRRL